MSLVRVHNFAISLDGFGTGEGQSADAHFGHAGDRLHQWMFATRWWQPGGSGGVDDVFVQRHDPGIGAEIMGAGKWGHPGWHEDPEWKGAWGPNPPFHTPVFVLTHHPRPSIEMEGGTTFHFLDASPAEALETARKAAGGQDVRIGGGPTMLRDFLAAGLVDHLHIVVVPILLGRGVRLWDGLEGLEKDYQVEAISSPSGVTHVTFTRTSRSLTHPVSGAPRSRTSPARCRQRSTHRRKWTVIGTTASVGPDAGTGPSTPPRSPVAAALEKLTPRIRRKEGRCRA